MYLCILTALYENFLSKTHFIYISMSYLISKHKQDKQYSLWQLLWLALYKWNWILLNWIEMLHITIPFSKITTLPFCQFSVKTQNFAIESLYVPQALTASLMNACWQVFKFLTWAGRYGCKFSDAFDLIFISFHTSLKFTAELSLSRNYVI